MSKNYDPTKIQKRKRKSSSSLSNNDIQFNNQYTAKKRSPPPPTSQRGDDDWWEAGTMNEVGVYSALDDDTLSLISKRLHVDVKLLLSQNITIFPSLKISSKLEEGTSIQIPGKSLIYCRCGYVKCPIEEEEAAHFKVENTKEVVEEPIAEVNVEVIVEDQKKEDQKKEEKKEEEKKKEQKKEEKKEKKKQKKERKKI